MSVTTVTRGSVTTMTSCSRPPSLSPKAVVRLIKNYYSFQSVEESSIKEFVSYADRNYYFRGQFSAGHTIPQYPSKQRVHITSNNEFVLKVLNDIDSLPDTVEMLTAMKKHLYRDGFNVPFPIPTLQGQEIIPVNESVLAQYNNIDQECDKKCNGTIDAAAAGIQYCLRILTFIPGKLLREVPSTPNLMFKMGQHLGSIHSSLQSFSHRGMSRKILDWDLQHLSTLRPRVEGVKDPVKCENVTKIIDNFEANVIPLIPTFPHNVIHGDCNDMNVLIAETRPEEIEINGLIDFSDCAYTPIVFDLGIAMTYAMLEKPDPLNSATPLLAGFLSSFPMSTKELDLLYYIILGRLTQTCVNGEYAFHKNPSNEYIMISVKPAWHLMHILLAAGKERCDCIWSEAIPNDSV